MPFLLGVDVEDPRHEVVGGRALPPRVPSLVDRLLAFLRARDAKATFFVVGAVAREHPETVRAILREGHEVGCHSDRHTRVEKQDPAEFRADTRAALDALLACGAGPVRGYRAPCFSLGRKTRWAYPILGELGFHYSSSVVPAVNPLYGWPGFGRGPKRMEGGIWELPVTLLPHPFPPLPMGGVYFRALPRWLIRLSLKAQRGLDRPPIGYLHPYDIDAEQPRFAHPGFARGGIYDRLMHLNRRDMLARLAMVEELGFRFETMRSWADALDEDYQ